MDRSFGFLILNFELKWEDLQNEHSEVEMEFSRISADAEKSGFETGLYLPDTPITILSLQVLGLSPSIYYGQRWKETTRTRKFTVYPPTSYFGIGRGPDGYPQNRLSSIPITSFSDSILNPKRDLLSNNDV